VDQPGRGNLFRIFRPQPAKVVLLSPDLSSGMIGFPSARRIMSGFVVRLAGVEQPVTKIFNQDVVTIGTTVDCDLVIDIGKTALPVDSLLITLQRQAGVYRVATLDPLADATRGGEMIAIGDPIVDGDTFYFGATGIRLRFFFLSGTDGLTQSLQVGNAVLESTRTAPPSVSYPRRRRLIPRTDIAIVFVKQLLRELVAEIPRRVLYASLAIIIFIVLTFLYFNTLSLLVSRSNNKAIGEMKDTLRETRQDIDKIRAELQQAREESANMRSSLSLPENVVRNYGQGICLIYGTYVFIDPRVGREIRFKESSLSDNPVGQNGEVNLSADGSGRTYEIEFIGTGFLAERGFILTNRHVVHAWEEDDLASLIRMRGFRPRLKEVFAYFPLLEQPFPLRVVDVLSDQDVALCAFDQGDRQLPILPLEENAEAIISGQPVVLIGYPAGLEGLVARFSDRSRTATRNFGNLSFRTQLNELASSSRIRPQATQGYITDVAPQLTYDARTDEGGSGGPVFGVSGRVIGINQAILFNSQASTTFGVPIRYGIGLLRKHSSLQPVAGTQNTGR
jgi:serine protease Do